MNVLIGLFILCVVGIVADTVVKVSKARLGGTGGKALRTELDELTRLVQDQSAALADAQSTIISQAEQLQELHERVDFAERMLTQVRERGALGKG